MEYILVLFKDGSYLVYPKENFKNMVQNTFEVGARFFEISEKVTIDQLSIWSACGYNTKYFKEVDPWDSK